MTPLAARLFRSTTNKGVRKALLRSQFFECSQIYPLAKEMVADDLETGCQDYSEMAQLPSPKTIIEFMLGGNRLMLFAEQRETTIRYMAFLADRKQGAVYAMESGFELGTPINLHPRWDRDVLMEWADASGMDPDNFGEQQAKGINGLLEKMLCMMSQKGLVEPLERSIDKRILREAIHDDLADGATTIWAECRIRPGRHGQGSKDGDSATMKLHYVRKYFKPSLQKWVDGYWRGDADLGIHLKWYSVSASGLPNAGILERFRVN